MCDECEYAEDCFEEENCVFDEEGNLKEAEDEDEEEEEEKDCTDPIADALRNILNEQEERFRKGHEFITKRFNKTI